MGALSSIFMKDMLGFVKPFDSTLPIDHRDSYYMEREWRMHGNLHFQMADVCSVVVHSDFRAEAMNDLPHLAGKIKAMASR